MDSKFQSTRATTNNVSQEASDWLPAPALLAVAATTVWLGTATYMKKSQGQSLNDGMDNAGSTSRAMSADRACTEITLPQASSAQTPPAAQNDGIEGNAEVVSTPQAPRADMRFDTLEDAQRHYLAFARRRGFGIRYNYKKKSEVTDEYIRAAMVCHKAGHQAKEKEDTQKPKPVVPERMKCSNIRTDCPARMALKVRDGTWLVTEICDDHNHPLLKKWSLTGFLRSHRDIPEEDQEFIKILHTVNMETSRMMQVMATLYESVEGVPYTPKDMANFRSKLRAENKYIDMQNTMAYFEDLKSRDKDFYYRYKLDDEDRVQSMIPTRFIWFTYHII
ncbi:hypothetical protein ACQ4PT_036734 [Festuca glaucescens]